MPEYVYAILKQQKRNRSKIVGVYLDEGSRADAIKNYFSRKGISGIPEYDKENIVSYVCPNGDIFKYQTIKIGEEIKDRS